MAATDKILISRIDCLAVIGVTPEERALKQRLSIDVEFLIDARKPGKTDSLKDAIDYSQVAAVVAEVCGQRPYHLIETVAELIAELDAAAPEHPAAFRTGPDASLNTLALKLCGIDRNFKLPEGAAGL